MDTLGIEQMLSALRTTATQASGKPAESTATSAAGVAGGDFAQLLKSSIDKVNQTQQGADQMAEKLAAGDTSQNLHTASVSFQEMVQVRNKLVTAYQDVMNIQV